MDAADGAVTVRSGDGDRLRHSSVAREQRPANRQPPASSAGAGTVPGIDGSRSGTGRPAEYVRVRAEQRGGVGVRRPPSTAATVPASTTWPAYMTATSSHRSATTPRSWLTIYTDRPVSLTSERSRLSISACTVTSSAVVGSSAMSSRGEPVSASAMQTRCAMPPDSWCG